MDPTGDRKFGHIALAVDHVRMPAAIPSPTHWSPPRASSMQLSRRPLPDLRDVRGSKCRWFSDPPATTRRAQ
jgi:hypothetical protein